MYGTTPPGQRHLPPRWRRLLGGLVLIGVLSGLLVLGFTGWRVYGHAQKLHSNIQALEALARSATAGSPDPTAAISLLADMQRNIQALQDDAQPLLAITNYVGWLPVYGSDLAAAEPLLTLAVHLTAAADATATALLPLLDEYGQTQAFTTITPTLLQQLPLARPHLEQARQSLRQALAARQRIMPTTLSSPLHKQLQRIDALLPLLDTTIHLGLAASDGAAGLAPILREHDATQPRSVRLTHQLVAARPSLEQARQALAYATTTWTQIPTDTLPAPLRAQMQRIAPLLPVGQDMLDLALIAPQLLGVPQPRTYLLIAQNPDELRATGGFISSVGLLRLHRGHSSPFALLPSEHIDAQRLIDGPYVDPPAPLRRYMDIQQWALRDANWSPDFPTSARPPATSTVSARARPSRMLLRLPPPPCNCCSPPLAPSR